MDLFELIALLENHQITNSNEIELSDVIDELVQCGNLDPAESKELVNYFKEEK